MDGLSLTVLSLVANFVLTMLILLFRMNLTAARNDYEKFKETIGKEVKELRIAMQADQKALTDHILATNQSYVTIERFTKIESAVINMDKEISVLVNELKLFNRRANSHVNIATE